MKYSLSKTENQHFTLNLTPLQKNFYYIDTDEIPGFLLLLKNNFFTERSIFILHGWGYWCGQGYQHNYPITIELLAQARGRLIWNFIHKMASRGEDSRVTSDFLDELPNFHIDIFSEREEHPGRYSQKSRKVMLKNSLKGKKMQTLKERPSTT